MAKQRKTRTVSPATQRITSLPGTVKDELDTKAGELIENVLKPKHVQPPPEGSRSNSIVDITIKWVGSKCYFISIYRTPSQDTFEAKFARMEFVGNGKFNLSFMRHTGKWIELYARQTVDECLKAIRDDPWFVP
jgi:hypothetical protein